MNLMPQKKSRGVELTAKDLTIKKNKKKSKTNSGVYILFVTNNIPKAKITKDLKLEEREKSLERIKIPFKQSIGIYAKKRKLINLTRLTFMALISSRF